jgi:VanZ family protein
MKRSIQLTYLKNYINSIIVASLIAYGSLASGENIPETRILNWEHADKLVHALMYMVFSLVLTAANTRLLKKYSLLYAIVISIIYGGIMEILQFTLTQTRHAEFWDMGANALGAITGAYLFLLIKKSKYATYL